MKVFFVAPQDTYKKALYRLATTKFSEMSEKNQNPATAATAAQSLNPYIEVSTP